MGPVTVEEIEILVKANIKDALAGMAKLREQAKDTFSAQLPNVQSQTAAIKQASEQINRVVSQNSKSIQDAAQQIKDAIKEISSNAQSAAESAEKSAESSTTGFKKARSGAQALEKEISKVKAEMDKIANSHIDKLSDFYKKDPELLEQAKNALLGTDEEYQKLAVKLDILNDKLLQYKTRTQEVKEATENAARAKMLPLYSAAPQREESAPKVSPSTPSEVPNTSRFQRFMAQFYASLNNVKSALGQIGIHGKESFGKVETAANSATNATKKYGNYGSESAHKVETATKSATRSAKKYGDQLQRSAKKGTNGFSRLLNILKYAMLFSIAYRAFGQVIEGVKTGINDMAWATNSANAAMSRLATSSLYLKNSFATAVMPLIQAITPAITQLINKLAELFNWIGMLNARIFGGASTVVVAKKASVDYAGTLGKTAYKAKQAANAEKEAAKAAKEAADANKGSLADFDELDVIQTKKSSTSSTAATPETASDAGEGMPAYEDMFETKKIPSDLASLGDKIKTELAKWREYAQPTIDAFKLLAVSLEPLKTFVAKGFEDFYNDYLVPLGKWTLGTGLPELLQILTRFNLDVNWSAINKGIDDIWKALEPFAEHVGEGLLWFLDHVLEPVGEWCMNTIAPKVLDIIATSIKIIDDAIEAAKPAFVWFWNNFLQPMGEWTGGVVASALQTIADALHALDDVLKGDLPKAAEDGKKALNDLWNLVGSIFGEGGSSIQLTAFSNKVSESTQRAMKAFNALSESADKDLKQLEWSGDKVTKDMADKINKNIQGMADQTIAGFKRQRDESISTIQDLSSITGGLSKQEADEIIKNVNEGYDKRVKSEQDGQDKIKKILDTASSEHRGLTKNESDQINKIKSQMYDNGVKALSKNQIEEQAIYDNMRVNHTKLSAQEAADVVKNSKTTTDKVIADANKQYNDRVAAIIRERDETHTISSDQADKLIKAADKERDGKVKAAEDGHQKVVAEAKKQSGDLVDQVDWQNGTVKSKWDIFSEDLQKSIKTKWAETKKWWENSAIVKWWNDDVAPWFTKKKWQDEFEHVQQAAKAKWDEIKKWWDGTAIVKWWNGSVAPWFTKKKWTDMMAGVKDAFKSIFKDAANTAIGMLDKVIDAINWVISGLNKIHISTPEWAPGGSKTFGVNIPHIKAIPKLATGGVLKQSTLVNVAEYAGAAQNPEIVAPQNIMKETVEDANGPFAAEILNELEALRGSIVSAIMSKDLSLSIDSTQLDRAARPAREAEDQRIGKALFGI